MSIGGNQLPPKNLAVTLTVMWSKVGSAPVASLSSGSLQESCKAAKGAEDHSPGIVSLRQDWLSDQRDQPCSPDCSATLNVPVKRRIPHVKWASTLFSAAMADCNSRISLKGAGSLVFEAFGGLQPGSEADGPPVSSVGSTASCRPRQPEFRWT
jgi:hypothetical protein